MSKQTCTKCGFKSGDDWTQCGGSCPMPMSPHYRLDPKELNDYGKQLYWMAEGLFGICGDLIRSFERGDGKHDEEDAHLRYLVNFIRHKAEETEATLKRLAANPKKGYEVLK